MILQNAQAGGRLDELQERAAGIGECARLVDEAKFQP